MTTDPHRRRLTRGERRDNLLDAAAALLTDAGFEGVTMEGVAARSGVSKGLGYAYFDNRDDLLAALFDRELGRLDARAQAAGDQAALRGGIEGRLRGIIVAGLDAVVDQGPLIGALLRGKAPAGPLEQRRQRRQLAVEQYFTTMAVDAYGMSERSARAAVSMLFGAYAAALDLWIHGRATRDEITDAFVTLATGGLRSLGTPPATPADAP